MTKSEGMTKPEWTKRRLHNSEDLDIRASDFFRHSSFKDLCKSGSWSQCIRKSEMGLSMNRPTPAPSEEGSRHWSAPCQFPSWEGSGVGSWSQCIRKSERGLSMNRNSQTRMTNDQIRRNDQTRMDETGDCTTQRIWTFEL